jgi:ferric-dicitrate binding protein FerR (iron transport regulator)
MTNVDLEALEDLLRHAPPRPTPSQEDEVAVRAAVRQEWRELTDRRQKRRRIAQYAIAATVLVGVFAGFNAFRGPTVEAVQVATIEKNIGPVYLLGEQAELRETADLANIVSGQIIVTGADAGLSIAWGSGGSIRIDENSRIEFTDSQSVFLESGRVYFDSQNTPMVAGIDKVGELGVTLRTEFGDVEHLGTQYMTEVAADTLIVSVREGRVAIDGTYHDHMNK